MKLRLTENDYKKFLKFHYLERNLLNKVILLIIISLFFGFFEDENGEIFNISHIKSYFTQLFIIFTIINLFIYYISIYKLKRKIKSNILPINKDLILSIDNHQISLDGNGYALNKKWNEIKYVENNEDYYFIHFKSENYLIIHKIHLAYEEIANIDNIIETNFTKIKNRINAKAVKKVYLWGLIGLIPNFGLIAGLILTYKGIVKYKDKILTSIGVLCIIYTFLFWKVFNLYSGEIISNDDNAKVVTTKHLNELVKEIEFFKLQNNIYPENLSLLKKQNQNLWIHDEYMLGISKEKPNSTEYIYYKFKDSYTIFSVGPDKIEKTEDDIYPETESLKNVGFIRKQ